MYFPFFPIPLRENQFSCNLTRQGSKKIIVGSFFHLLDWKVLFLLRLTAITRSFSSAKCWPPLTISAPAPLASASIRAGAGATKKQDSGGGGGGGTHYNNVCWYTGHWLGWDNNGDGAGLEQGVHKYLCCYLPPNHPHEHHQPSHQLHHSWKQGQTYYTM